MYKRSSSQDDGRRSRDQDRDDRSWDRGGRDRREGRISRSVKKQRTDSSDTEGHHDVEILYNKVHKGRDGSDFDQRKFVDPAQNFDQPNFPPPIRRGQGLLGDAPEPVQRKFNPPDQRLRQGGLYHKSFPAPGPDLYQGPGQSQNHDHGGNMHDHHISLASRMNNPQTSSHNFPNEKPAITTHLLALSGSLAGPSIPHRQKRSRQGSSNRPLLSPDSPSSHLLPSAKQQKDGFWDLPSLHQNSSESRVDTREEDKKVEEPPWKSQIKELRNYVLKLENEKKDLAFNLESEKIQQLRDYIVRIEVEKQELIDKNDKSFGKEKENDGHMIEMIRSNIEKVKQAQDLENQSIESKKVKLFDEERRLQEEKRKLDQAKKDLKISLDNGMKFLNTEKTKMEIEIQKKKQAKLAANNKMLGRIKILEETVKEEKESRANEEKRHLATELEELETRKEMTIKTIESEAKGEELEIKLEEFNMEIYEMKQKMAKKDSENRKLSSEVSKAAKQNDELVQKLSITKSNLDIELGKRNEEEQVKKNNFDAEYTVFIKQMEEFDDTERIRCVFCPNENLQTVSNFIFHIAREHMFDQYKSSDIKEESIKVGMFLKVLEEKARKELATEMKVLNNTIAELKEKSLKSDEVIVEKQGDINELIDKTSALERDIETLLESEANHKSQIDNLVLRNNTLQNQIRNSSVGETMRIENQEMEKKISVLGREVNDLKERRLTLEREVDGLRQRWKEESSEKMGWKTRCRELTSEAENLKKRLEEMDSNRDNVKEILKEELNNANAEKDNLRQKISNLEEKIDELVSHKAIAEAQLLEIKAENEAMKEFRSDLSVINDVVCDDMRVENKTLKSKLSSSQNGTKNLKSELSKTRTSKNFVLNELNIAKKEANILKIELSDVKNENISVQQRLTDALEKIQVFEKNMEDCLKEQKAFDKDDTNFSFSMGFDSILRAPLDVINLQIENIDIDQLDSIDIDDAPQEESFKEKGNDESTVLAAVEIQINTPIIEEESTVQVVEANKAAGWSDDEFDYDLLNDSQEDVDQTKEKKQPSPSKHVPMMKDQGVHPYGCDCVDCDDCDVLHGYVSGKAQGIREMMRQNSIS